MNDIERRRGIRDVLTDLGPLPKEAVVVGTADDGLPVLLNIQDASIGPILVVGENGSGKIDFLRHLVASASMTHNQDELEIVIITDNPAQWRGFDQIPNVSCIFSAFSIDADNLLVSLASWGHRNRTKQRVFLVIDCLNAVQNHMGFDAKQTLRFLLERGVSWHIHPFVVLDTECLSENMFWIKFFKTRIFTRINDIRVLRALGCNVNNEDFALFNSGYVMREGDHWFKFWISDLH